MSFATGTIGRMFGVREMQAKLKQIVDKFPDRVAAAIRVEAEIEMTEAKRRCPVGPVGAKRRPGEVPGTLRASGMVHDPVRKGRNISVLLSFGGGAQDYAIAVHEHLSEHSPPSWVAAEESGYGIHWNAAGTGPKFLEGPLNESRPYMAERIARRVQLSKLVA